MPTTSPNPTASPAVSVLSVLSLLDPRRWVGLLFGILGVLASVIVPFLPAKFLKRMTDQRTNIVVIPRRQHARNASQASQTPSPAPVTPAFEIHPTQTIPVRPNLVNRRHTSLTLSTESCSITRHCLMRSTTPDSLARDSLSSSNIDIDSNLSLSGGQPKGLSSYNNNVARDVMPAFPPTSWQEPHVEPRRSLDSLDLAASAAAPSVLLSVTPQTMSKVTFRTPDLTGLKRSPSPDYHRYRGEGDTVSTAVVAHSAPGDTGQYTAELRGINSSLVKRSATLPSSAEPLPVRRKFSLFNRETPLSSTRSTKEVTASATLRPSPEVTSPSTQSLSSPLSPLSDSTISPATTYSRSPRSPDIDLSDGTPFGQLMVPPERPTRTDPYKKFNIPAPGTERARAFLKAEKEWVKAETERRERERVNKVVEPPGVVVAKVATCPLEKKEKKSKKTFPSEKTPLRRSSLPSSRQSTDDESSPSPLFLELREIEDRERPMVIIPETPAVDEFGVLTAPLSSVPEEDFAAGSSSMTRSEGDSLETPASQRPSSAQGRRVWLFSKRPESRDGTAKEEKKEKKSKRAKSRDTKIGSPFNLGGKKEGGYASDTVVTSLTYQLIS